MSQVKNLQDTKHLKQPQQRPGSTQQYAQHQHQKVQHQAQSKFSNQNGNQQNKKANNLAQQQQESLQNGRKQKINTNHHTSINKQEQAQSPRKNSHQKVVNNSEGKNIVSSPYIDELDHSSQATVILSSKDLNKEKVNSSSLLEKPQESINKSKQRVTHASVATPTIDKESKINFIKEKQKFNKILEQDRYSMTPTQQDGFLSKNQREIIDISSDSLRHQRQESAAKMRNYLVNQSRNNKIQETMKTQYGNSTRNSMVGNGQLIQSENPMIRIQLTSAQSILPDHNHPNQTQNHIKFKQSQRHQTNNPDEKEEHKLRRQRTANTPNHQSSKKNRLGFFLNTNKRPSVNEDIDHKSYDPQNNTGSNLVMRKERSESRQRRLQNMNDSEKQAFLQECVNIQNLVKTSVQNLTKIINEVATSTSVPQDNTASSNNISIQNITTNKIRRASYSPSKVLLKPEEMPFSPRDYQIRIIQNFMKKKLQKLQTLKKIKVLSKFRANVLAIFKGWVIRQKVMKSFMIRQVIKDIKSLRVKYQQISYLNQKTITEKQVALRGSIKERTANLLMKIHDQITNKRYLKKNKQTDSAPSLFSRKAQSNQQPKQRAKQDLQTPNILETEESLKVQKKDASQKHLLKPPDQPLIIVNQQVSSPRRDKARSPQPAQKLKEPLACSVISQGSSSSSSKSRDKSDSKFYSSNQENILLCQSMDQLESPKPLFQAHDDQQLRKKNNADKEALDKKVQNMSRLNITNESKILSHNKKKQSHAHSLKKLPEYQKDTSRKNLLTPKQEMPARFGRQSAIGKQRPVIYESKNQNSNRIVNNDFSTSLNNSKDQTKYLNCDLESVDCKSVQRETSKSKRGYGNASSKIDCWRREQMKRVNLNDDEQQIRNSVQGNNINTFDINKTTVLLTSDTYNAKQPQIESYHQVLNQMRNLFQEIKSGESSEVGGQSQKRREYKLQLERCIIDIRREFEIMCLEKFGQCD